MQNFIDKRTEAKHQWESLTNNTIPLIYLGTASCGRAAGALEVLKSLEETLQENHLKVRIIQVGCIGPCYLEPLMDIKLPGQPRISYANVTPRKAKTIIQSHFIKGVVPHQFALGHFKSTYTTPPDGIPEFFDLPMLKSQKRVVLRNCGIIDPEDINQYIATDGYMGFSKSISCSPIEVINIIKESGLRGRGGAGFPTAKKWEICRNAPGKIKYLICNADEGDPGAFMNRSLIEGDPHALLEGMLIAAYAIGATSGYIYIRAEYPLAILRLKKAIAQMRVYNLLGKNILDSGFDFDITIKEGAGAFVCGEETALMASIEGKRGMPRTRPPFPAVSGLNGKPTVINNAETLGTLPNILRNGADWYNQFGIPGSVGTKTFSLVGKIRRTGLIEVPLGMTLRQIIFDIGGGTKKPFKAVQTGGPSGGCLSEAHLDIPLTYESLREAGSIMGSGGLIVMDADTCVVDLAHYFLKFAQRESCGKCVPCRMGTTHLVDTLDRIVEGRGTLEDINRLQSLGDTIKKGSLCGLGQNIPNPVLTTLKYFMPEYLSHIQDHYCPASTCSSLYELTISPDQCTGCDRCTGVCSTHAISGRKNEVHILDQSLCIKCRACYDTCTFDAIHGQPIQQTTAEAV